MEIYSCKQLKFPPFSYYIFLQLSYEYLKYKSLKFAKVEKLLGFESFRFFFSVFCVFSPLKSE